MPREEWAKPRGRKSDGRRCVQAIEVQPLFGQIRPERGCVARMCSTAFSEKFVADVVWRLQDAPGFERMKRNTGVQKGKRTVETSRINVRAASMPCAARIGTVSPTRRPRLRRDAIGLKDQRLDNRFAPTCGNANTNAFLVSRPNARRTAITRGDAMSRAAAARSRASCAPTPCCRL